MATTRENVRKLPVTKKLSAPKPAPHKGPEVVINRVEVSISLAAPLMFGVPLRLVDWILESLGLMTKEQLAEVIEPGFDAKERKAAVARHPSAAKARKPRAA
jgi:hypothetical protein